MQHEQILFCFSALTWNVELLCTLSFAAGKQQAKQRAIASSAVAGDGAADSGTPPTAPTPPQQPSPAVAAPFDTIAAFEAYVSNYLRTFENYMIAFLQVRSQRRWCGSDHVHVDHSAMGVQWSDPSIAAMEQHLVQHYPVFYAHVSRALKPGDVHRRSVQHVVRGVYISAKYPVLQPLCLEYFGVQRVVQAYAGGDLHRCPPASLTIPHLTWQPLPWRGEIVGEERLFVASLPASGAPILRLVVPAVDDADYNLLQHFREDVFQFMDGTLPGGAVDAASGWWGDGNVWGSRAAAASQPMPTGCSGAPTRATMQMPQQQPPLCATLVHCSAGMHRSAAFVVAYLLRASALAGNPIDPVTGTHRSVDDWCAFLKTRRSVSMPTDAAKAQLAVFHARCVGPPSTSQNGDATIATPDEDAHQKHKGDGEHSAVSCRTACVHAQV